MPRGGARQGAGRKKLPKAKVRSKKLYCYVTPAEFARSRARAKKRKKKLRDWVRWKLMR